MKTLISGLLLFIIFLNSNSGSAQTSSGCLVIEDIGTGQPARTRLAPTPMGGSNINTTCFGFTGTFNLPRYTGVASNSGKCWNETFPGPPTCLFVTPGTGAWVCGRLGTFNLVTCPIDNQLLTLILIIGTIGFLHVRKSKLSIAFN